MKQSNVTVVQRLEPTKIKMVKSVGNVPLTLKVGTYMALLPASHFSLPLPNRSQSRLGQPVIFGKGRFGKRPASFSIDYGGHSNDNSNDSGLECDNSNSDSQFWGSSEDLRSVGVRTSAGVIRPLLTSHFQASVGEDSSSLDLRKSQNVFIPSEPSTTFMEQASNTPTPGTRLLLRSCSTEEQKMSSENSIQLMNPPQLSLRSNSLSRSVISSVPAKRSRFSFQTPAVPIKSAIALRLRNQNQPPRLNPGKRLPPGTPPTLSSPIAASSVDGLVQLQILAQPEEQHRARYQTEGSRGAIKDRKGNGFPAVKLVGYDKPATLQIFIGSDQGKVSPHMFYQACKVTGKSSTPCLEKKVEGTILIEIEFEQSKEMMISCDCVGILKERNVDVEQRFPFHHAASSRKKSTRCRLIFRTTIINSDGIQETLQVSSLPILCTQPPGQPEICKQSLSECFAQGGQELFIIGKNFLKDTKVVVQEETSQGELLWETRAEILKDYMQQNHLICVLPPYRDENILKPVDCKVAVWSGGKLSEPHSLTYLPNTQNVVYGVPAVSCVSIDTQQVQSQSMNQNSLQQQLTQSLLSVDMPMQGGSMMTSDDNMVPNSFIRESEAIDQMTDLVQTPITSSTTISSLNFENTMLAPTTTPQQERQVVSELQEILDHSSQTMMTMVETNPSDLTLGPTSFYGLNLALPMQLTMEVSSPFQQTSPVSQHSNTSPVPLFSEMSQHELRPGHSNSNLNPFDAALSCGSTMPQIMSMVQESVDSQIMCPTNDTVINCMTQVMKAEPISPGAETTCNQQQQAPMPNPQMMSVMNLMGGELHGDQGSIAIALTQLTDNELLNYINPSCFEQDVK